MLCLPMWLPHSPGEKKVEGPLASGWKYLVLAQKSRTPPDWHPKEPSKFHIYAGDKASRAQAPAERQEQALPGQEPQPVPPVPGLFGSASDQR